MLLSSKKFFGWEVVKARRKVWNPETLNFAFKFWSKNKATSFYNCLKAGEILNLISADGDRVVDGARALAAAIVPFIIFLVAVIIGLIVIGWPSLLGNFIVFLSVPIFVIFGKLMNRYRTEGSKLSGERIELLSEVLSSIRLIKMFNWEEFFFRRVENLRNQEASFYYRMNTTLCVLFGVNTIVATLAAVATFATMDQETLKKVPVIKPRWARL